MIVISDTSPINYLCRIGHITILPTLFKHVIIPLAVAKELSSPGAPEVVRRFISDSSSWWEIRAPRAIDPALVEFGAGEQQAISLAEELHADLLIVDDHDARQAAASKGIKVTGVLGVLKLAAEQQLLDFPQAVRELLHCGFYVSEDVLKRITNLIEQQDK